MKQEDSHGSSVDASVANVKNDQVKNVAGTGVEGGNEGNTPTPQIYTLSKTGDSNIADKTEDEQTGGCFLSSLAVFSPRNLLLFMHYPTPASTYSKYLGIRKTTRLQLTHNFSRCGSYVKLHMGPILERKLYVFHMVNSCVLW